MTEWALSSPETSPEQILSRYSSRLLATSTSQFDSGSLFACRIIGGAAEEEAGTEAEEAAAVAAEEDDDIVMGAARWV